MHCCGLISIHNPSSGLSAFGTLGCLVRRTGGGSGKPLFLTCAHVVAPPGFGIGKGTVEDMAGNPVGRVVAATAPPDGIDAALVELDTDIDPALGELGVPTGWSTLLWPGIELRCIGATTGIQAFTTEILADRQTARIPYPGPNGTTVTWRLDGQLHCRRPFGQGGDSGAMAVDRNGLLVGMLVGIDADSSNAVLTPIKRIIDHFAGQPNLSFEPIVHRLVAPPAPRPPDTGAPPWNDAVRTVPPPVGSPLADADVLAWTLWGEAFTDWRAIGDDAYRAVAEVVVNRLRKGGYGETVVGVCKRRFQFSCWLEENNPNFVNMESGAVRATTGFDAAKTVASATLAGWTGTLTGGATHYHADYIAPPSWAKGKISSARIGHHIFYNTID